MNNNKIIEQVNQDGIDRRGFLQCMAWVGTAVVWSLGKGGVLTSQVLGAEASRGIRLSSGIHG